MSDAAVEYLHRIHVEGEAATFLPTTVRRLQDALFLDGRTEFATGPPVRRPWSDVSDAASDSTTPRLILHMAFCGSTHLARMIDDSGAALVLKEPQTLVDLSDAQRSLDDRLGPLLDGTLSLLSRPLDQRPIVIKPSNWANPLMPHIAARNRDARLMFITIDRRAFLHAVFRGGSERMAFIARAAAHFAPFVTGGAAWLREAMGSVEEPLARMARIALVAHRLQLSLLEAAGPGIETIDFAMIRDRPAEALEMAARMLGIEIDAARAATVAAASAGRDAKRAGGDFSAERRARENDEVERHHGERFDSALAWAMLELDR